LIRVSVASKETMSFSVHQFNQSYFGRDPQDIANFMRIILGREDKNGDIEYIDARSGDRDSLCISTDCEPGEYYLWVEIQGKGYRPNNFVFRTYSNETPISSEVKGEKSKGFLRNVVTSIAQKQGKKKYYTDKGEPKISKSIGIDEDKSRFGYIYYENNSDGSTLKEEICFTDIRGLVAVDYPRKLSAHIEVGPGEQKLVLLDQLKKSYILKCEYYTSIHQSTESLKDLVKLKGERKQIIFGDKPQRMYYYVLDNGDGYTWMFENESESTIFDGTFHFTLTNLEIVDAEEKSSWKIHLKPGKRIYMRMNTVDITKAWGYKCKLSFRITEDLSNEDKLLQKLWEEGERHKCSLNGEEINVFYTILFINDMYVWYFENKSQQKFSGIFKFYLENLKAEDDDEDVPRTQWDLFLNPGQTCIRKMHQIDPLKNSNYECSYSCKLL